MNHHYVEAKPNVLSTINIVPLIGVLAALLVVIMASLPGLTQEHVVHYSDHWGCDGMLPHRHTLDIHIHSDGTISLDGQPTSQKNISDFIKTGLLQTNHHIFAELDVDTNAAYQDVMTTISALQGAGLEANHIRILDSYE